MRRSNPAGIGPARRHPRKAFSLQEMLVVVGIIIVLVALITPTLTSIQEVRRRAVCSTNNKAFATLCLQYAMAQGAISRDPTQRLALPVGRVDDPEDFEDRDNYLKMSDASYQILHEKYGLQEAQAMCASMPSSMDPEDDRSPLFDVAAGMASGDTPMPAIYMGLIYWGGREHIWELPEEGADPPPDPADPPEWVEPLFYSFRSKDLHKDQYPDTEEWYEYTPTSTTLVTCMMFDVNATGNATDIGDGLITDCPENVSIMPHSKSRFRTYAKDEVPEMSTGVVVGYTDGSAQWKETTELRSIDQFQRLWYDPQ